MNRAIDQLLFSTGSVRMSPVRMEFPNRPDIVCLL